MYNVEEILNRLSKSKFRNSFKLEEIDIEYINKKGLKVIEEHAFQFIQKRLSSNTLLNDGKQTPMKGHPVFIAQHATATCCRGCLNKWYGISSKKELTIKEQEYIVKIIMIWIKKNMK